MTIILLLRIFMVLMTNDNKINKIFDFLNKYWYLSSFINSLIALWFVIIEIFGKQLGLVNDKGILNISATIFTVIIIIISISFNIISSILDSQKTKMAIEGQNILKDTMSSQIYLSSARIKSFKKIMHDGYIPFKTLLFNTTYPYIDDVIRELNSCISKNVKKIPRESIGISIIVKYDFDDLWKYAAKINLDNPMSIEKIVYSENSTAKQIIDGKIDCIFVSKDTAIKQGKYIIDNKDIRYNNKGTIICKNIDVAYDDNKKPIKAVLNISTYDCELCPENDEITKSKMLSFIKPFEKNIQYSLCLSYIRESYTFQSKKNEKLKSEKTS